MDQQILEIPDYRATPSSGASAWRDNPQLINALESGKVLYFPSLGFEPLASEQRLFTPDIRDPKKRNISLDANGVLKGAAGDAATQQALAHMVGRFRDQAQGLIQHLFPAYTNGMKLAPTSFRPSVVENRAQSWRADDKRLHVDAFPSRPNRGERLLRVFTNVNPHGEPRVWRIGEPFDDVARRFLPRIKPYRAWQARALHRLHITKSERSEYDHVMLQLHDNMKSDLTYQRQAPQQTVNFAPGSTWVCFTDQASHAAMAGQYMLEQTLQLPAGFLYAAHSSPLAILTTLLGHPLI